MIIIFFYLKIQYSVNVWIYNHVCFDKSILNKGLILQEQSSYKQTASDVNSSVLGSYNEGSH